MSIKIARYFDAHIVCGDSRQVYKEMRIGTAVPTEEELTAVPHHLVQFISATEPYNVGCYERDALNVLDELFQHHDTALVVGGSGLYLDALCHGIDDMPDADLVLRDELSKAWSDPLGRKMLLDELKSRDPKLWETIDRNNPLRVCRAIEVCRLTGEPYSALRSGKGKERPFDVIKIGLRRDREELYDRINARVDNMLEEGLVEEAQSLLPLRDYNALQTVGYRELFDYFDGTTTLDKAIELIKRNTRRYAKRQTTWFGRDNAITWFHPNDYYEAIRHIES